MTGSNALEMTTIPIFDKILERDELSLTTL
jgi:hypothetical protein